VNVHHHFFENIVHAMFDNSFFYFSSAAVGDVNNLQIVLCTLQHVRANVLLTIGERNMPCKGY